MNRLIEQDTVLKRLIKIVQNGDVDETGRKLSRGTHLAKHDDRTRYFHMVFNLEHSHDFYHEGLRLRVSKDSREVTVTGNLEQFQELYD